MKNKISISLLGLFMLLALQSCFEDAPQQTTTVDENTLEQFANDVDSLLAGSHYTGLNELINFDILFDRATKDLEIMGFIKSQMKSQMESEFTFDAQMLNLGEVDNTEIERLKIYEEDDEKRISYRVVVEKSQLSYLDFVVVEAEDGKPYIVDVFLYSIGELVTETMGATMDVMMGDGLLSIDENVIMDYNNAFTALQTNDFETFVAVYDSADTKIQDQKMFELFHLKSLYYSKGESFESEVEAYESKYIDDASLYLMLVNLYSNDEDMDSYNGSLEKLRQLVDDDEYLLGLKANS